MKKDHAATTLFDLDGRTVVVTGALGHLGSAIAIGLAGCGARVAFLGHNLAHAEAVLERMDPEARDRSMAVKSPPHVR